MRGSRRLRRRNPLDGVNLLHLHPLRTADWEDDGESVVLVRRVPGRRGIRGLGQRIDHLLGAPRLKLDATGSFAWRLFDGETSVGDVAHQMRSALGEDAEPVEQRLGSFVRLLHRERLIRYAEEKTLTAEA